MLVVKIELHSAITGRATLLGSMIIANTGTSSDPKRGDYAVSVGRKSDACDLRRVHAAPLRTGEVRGYPRLSYNVWRLVLRALAAAFPEEKVRLPDADSIEHELETV